MNLLHASLEIVILIFLQAFQSLTPLLILALVPLLVAVVILLLAAVAILLVTHLHAPPLVPPLHLLIGQLLVVHLIHRLTLRSIRENNHDQPLYLYLVSISVHCKS